MPAIDGLSGDALENQVISHAIEHLILAVGTVPAMAWANQVISHAIEHLIPRHLERVRNRREELVDKTLHAVQEWLTKEINYWDRRATELRQQERDGKPNARLNSALAQQRADELATRLERREEEMALERQILAAPPVLVGAHWLFRLGCCWAKGRRRN